MSRTDLTSQYIELVESLGRKLGNAHGWQRQVAAQLGIDQPTLSKIVRGDRKVGWELAQRAVKKLGLDPGYFSHARPKSARSTPVAPTDTNEAGALIAKLRAGVGTTKDVYALARSVADSAVVREARSILKTRQPRTEQQIGALFLAASKLLDLLEKEEVSGPKSRA